MSKERRDKQNIHLKAILLMGNSFTDVSSASSMDELTNCKVLKSVLYKDCFQNGPPFLIFGITFCKAIH